MKIYVVRFEDADQRTIVRSEFFSPEEQMLKIQECAEKRINVIDAFDDEI